MCQRNGPTNIRSTPSSTLTLRMARVTILLIIFYFIQDAAGGINERPSIYKKKISSCINYGHSCWGAHGKRNDITSKNTEAKEDLSSSNVPTDTRWFLTRLSPAAAYKLMKNQQQIQRDIEAQPMKDGEIAESVPMKRNQPEDEVVDYQDLPPIMDAYYPEVFHSRPLSEKFRFLNFLKSQKLN